MLAKNTKQVAILLGWAGLPIGGEALERFVGYGGWDQRGPDGTGHNSVDADVAADVLVR